MPDLVLLDQPPRRVRHGHASDRKRRLAQHLAWFDHLAVHSHYVEPTLRKPWVAAVGMTTLILVTLLTMWICWAVWTDDPKTDDVDAIPWLCSTLSR